MSEEIKLQNTECDDEENIVTMEEFLKAEEIMEENADAVLGPGDDKNCTYSEGYLKRQALYSCLTCLPADGTTQAGICLACSYHCHGDHDLVELYTKRNFRCDCGNSLFKNQKCNLDPVKSSVNEKNCYNQNFKRLYCSCSRTYPDPEDDDDMIQCCICEDWFHSRHLGSSVPKGDDYSEMMCGSCTDRLPFLQYYLGYCVVKVSSTDKSKEVDVNMSVNGEEELLNSSELENQNDSTSKDVSAANQTEGSQGKTQGTEITVGSLNKSEEPRETKDSLAENKSVQKEDNSEKANGVPENKSEQGQDVPVPKQVDSNNMKEEPKECLLTTLKKLPRGSGATFWPENFRKMLCTCSSCMEMYKKNNVPFITDEDDTVSAYEERGKLCKRENGASRDDVLMGALSSLDRVQQMEAILGYNDLKSNLSEYLSKFAENKKVVREEDIREFFAGMKARKKQKLDIPYNCR